MNLDKSYKNCQLVFKNYSKSYYLGAHLFSYSEFKQICAFYAFLRIIDDIVDSDISLSTKKFKLVIFKLKFLYCYNNYSSELVNKYEWGEYQDCILAIFDSLVKLNIYDRIFNKFFISMELDLIKFKYHTYDELLIYMDGSAGIVGEIMYLIMTQNNKNMRNFRTKQHARDLGIAFQLTNFIRDVLEDRNMNPSRIYLPKKDQNFYKINLSNDNFNKKTKFFIKDQISRNMNYYYSAENGINALPKKYHNSLNIAKNMGIGILKKIEKNDFNVFTEKKKNLTKYEKFIIIKDTISFFSVLNLIKNYLLYNFF
jgi:15-cis-phytoene synthase